MGQFPDPVGKNLPKKKKDGKEKCQKEKSGKDKHPERITGIGKCHVEAHIFVAPKLCLLLHW